MANSYIKNFLDGHLEIADSQKIAKSATLLRPSVPAFVFTHIVIIKTRVARSRWNKNAKSRIKICQIAS